MPVPNVNDAEGWVLAVRSFDRNVRSMSGWANAQLGRAPGDPRWVDDALRRLAAGEGEVEAARDAYFAAAADRSEWAPPAEGHDGITASAYQRAAADTPAAAVEVNAGPGTGKTHTLCLRAARLIERGVPGSEIAIITYTKAMAAEDLAKVRAFTPSHVVCGACGGFDPACSACLGEGRVAVTDPAVGTMHSFALRWVHAALVAGGPAAEAIRATQWIDGTDFGIALPEDVDDMIRQAQADAKASGIKITQRELRDGLSARGEEVAEGSMRVLARRALAARSLVGFDDLLELAIVALSAGFNTGIRHFLVDEKQDFTTAHWTAVDLAVRNSNGTIYAVGDDGQAIFGFLQRKEDRRQIAGDDGARDSLLGFAESFDLPVTYRFSGQIAVVVDRIRRALAEEGSCSELALVPSRTRAGDVEFVAAAGDGFDEAALGVENALFVAEAPHDVAVIARRWEELAEVELRLISAGVPVSMSHRAGSNWSSAAGRAALAVVKTAASGTLDFYDAKTILDYLGEPGEADRRRTAAMAKEVPLIDAMDAAGFVEWFALKETRFDLWRLAALLERAAPAWAAHADAIRSLSSECGSADEALLTILEERDAPRAKVVEGCVTLTTFHGAKGLEWSHVVVYGACEGSLPHKMDRTEEQVAEAGRALYVGASRAKDTLTVVIPTALRGKPRRQSRWLRYAREERQDG